MNLPTVFWIWAAVALLLIGAETVLPGVYLLWLGVAAAVVALVLFTGIEIGILGQVLLFGVAAFCAVGAYLRWGRGIERPLTPINRMTERFLGQTYVLQQPIDNGRGRVQIGDAFWTVVGPELPAGTRVRVTGHEDGCLRVTPEPSP